MRKGTALLTRLMVAACTLCLFALAAGETFAVELEETESGAPSAVVMFPRTGKTEAILGVMNPVVFNHLAHERAVAECESCHHTGDPMSCVGCHTLEGSPDANYINLERAMHAVNIKARHNVRTPSSCVSCHEEYISKKQECMGCHNIVTPPKDDKWCNVCHNAELDRSQIDQGTTGTMFFEENLAAAAKKVIERKNADNLPGYFEPTKVVIGSLANEYQPNIFNHRRHVASVVDRIKDDKLAGAFHYQKEVICATCHHRSPLSMTPPKCSSCHYKRIDPNNPGKPNLKAAYHLQCMGCHEGMNVKRPAKQDCQTCHKDAASN